MATNASTYLSIFWGLYTCRQLTHVIPFEISIYRPECQPWAWFYSEISLVLRSPHIPAPSSSTGLPLFHLPTPSWGSFVGFLPAVNTQFITHFNWKRAFVKDFTLRVSLFRGNVLIPPQFISPYTHIRTIFKQLSFINMCLVKGHWQDLLFIFLWTFLLP